jgi:predicted nucleic acid-binding protein
MRLETLFIDTSFFVARFNRQDSHHLDAQQFLQRVRAGQDHFLFLTTDYIFDETITTLLYQTQNHATTAECGHAILTSKIRLEYVAPRLFQKTWQFYLDRPDKLWSFTDCSSFLFMELMGLKKALTFDRNFQQAGFAMLP